MISPSRTTLVFMSLSTLMIITGFAVIHYPAKHSTPSAENKKAFHAIIFDLDGTVIDTDPLWKKAVFCTLDTYAPTIAMTQKNDVIQTCSTCGVYETVVEVINHLKNNHEVTASVDEVFQTCMPHLRTIYQEEGIQFIPDFDQFYQQVKAADLKTAIATSSQQHLIELMTTIIPLESYFGQHIYHVDHVNRAYKPKPDVYLYAAEKIGVDPQYCIAIEDTATGIKAAKAAGMYCIGINTAKNRALLQQADEIVEGYADINIAKLLYGKDVNL